MSSVFLAFSAFIQSGNLSGNYAISKMNIKTISQLLLHVKRKNRDKNKYFLTLLYYFYYLFNFWEMPYSFTVDYQVLSIFIAFNTSGT